MRSAYTLKSHQVSNRFRSSGAKGRCFLKYYSFLGGRESGWGAIFVCFTSTLFWRMGGELYTLNKNVKKPILGRMGEGGGAFPEVSKFVCHLQL